MQQKLILTADGSHSLEIPELRVTYHSMHGAIQESLHVFITVGLQHVAKTVARNTIGIFEMGFGTGLNALLTLIEAEKLNQKIYYECVELFPLGHEQVQSLNYCNRLRRPDIQPLFERLHDCDWGAEVQISPHFILKKTRTHLLNYRTAKAFELIFFDAFDPNVQPELWTPEIFEKMFSILHPGGILVTYCAKGVVRRAMQAVGFNIEKLAGPPGKREIIRGTRL